MICGCKGGEKAKDSDSESESEFDSEEVSAAGEEGMSDEEYAAEQAKVAELSKPVLDDPSKSTNLPYDTYKKFRKLFYAQKALSLGELSGEDYQLIGQDCKNHMNLLERAGGAYLTRFAKYVKSDDDLWLDLLSSNNWESLVMKIQEAYPYND
jgi:hypothetical protein